jgi:hypothetical protein
VTAGELIPLAIVIAILFLILMALFGREANVADVEGRTPVAQMVAQFFRKKFRTRESAFAFAGDILRFLVVAAIALLGLGIAFAGILILGFQCYSWLQSGSWIQISAVDVISAIYSSEWLSSPDTWLGVHKILQSLPGWILPIPIGLVIFFTALQRD